MKCCELTAGKLRHIIQIQRATDTPDGAGGTVRVWETLGTVRAFVNPVSSREAVQLDAIRSTLAARCLIRFRADVTASDVILFDGKRYAIQGDPVDIENARKWLDIPLERGAPI